MAVKHKLPVFKPWHPFHANLTPPAGFYDPALDANLGNVNRGLGDTVADSETQGSRLTSDFALGKANIDRMAGRDLADLGTQRTTATQDHATALADLQQAYSRQASSQQQSMNAAGLLGGGAAMQAAEKRAANQAHDQAPLDTNFQRVLDSINTATGRVGEDQQQQLGDLGLKTQRGLDDLTTSLTRSKREAAAFGLDTSAAKAAQASQAGWDPYAGRKANESGTGAGAHRVVVHGGIAYTIDPSGRIISKRKAAH